MKRQDKAYFDLIRTLPCFGCGTTQNIECSHLRKSTDGGIGMKPSPCYVLPKCRNCHSLVHSKGEVTFYGGMNKIYRIKTWCEKLYASKGDFWEFRRVYNKMRKDMM